MIDQTLKKATGFSEVSVPVSSISTNAFCQVSRSGRTNRGQAEGVMHVEDAGLARLTSQ